MTYLLSIDPGTSSGFALGYFSDDEPYRLVQAFQVTGGAVGLRDFLLSIALYSSTEHRPSYDVEPRVTICEKFTARQPLTRKMEEALKAEGWLEAERRMPRHADKPSLWGDPAAQYFAGGKDKAEKKKRQHAWLKEHDLYVTGSMVGQPNADDARSAIAHAIAYLRRIDHRPTLEHYFPERS